MKRIDKWGEWEITRDGQWRPCPKRQPTPGLFENPLDLLILIGLSMIVIGLILLLV